MALTLVMVVLYFDYVAYHPSGYISVAYSDDGGIFVYNNKIQVGIMVFVYHNNKRVNFFFTIFSLRLRFFYIFYFFPTRIELKLTNINSLKSTPNCWYSVINVVKNYGKK